MLRDFVHILITWESDDDVPILNLSGGPFVSYGRRRGVRLFDRYEYLLISLMNRLYW